MNPSSKLFALLVLASSFAWPLYAGVESLGGKASITIPSNWTVTSRAAPNFQASNSTNSVNLSIFSSPADTTKSITVKDYNTMNILLQPLLNSFELDTVSNWSNAGYPVTEIANNYKFNGGVSKNSNFYTSYIIRRFSITDYNYTFNYYTTHAILSDGLYVYMIKLIIWDGATKAETDEASNLIDLITSSNIKNPLVDSDGDGVNNFDEVILYGTNPYTANAPEISLLQGPTITSDLTAISIPKGTRITPYIITTNFSANAFSAAGLPTGLNLNATTGVVTGNPTKKGTFLVSATASKKIGSKVSSAVTVTKTITVY